MQRKTREARREFTKRARRGYKRVGRKLILARVWIIAQLSLPTERSRFRSDMFGLGDKALLLIEHREAGVSQFVIGRDGDQSLAQIDGFIELPQVGIGHR